MIANLESGIPPPVLPNLEFKIFNPFASFPQSVIWNLESSITPPGARCWGSVPGVRCEVLRARCWGGVILSPDSIGTKRVAQHPFSDAAAFILFPRKGAPIHRGATGCGFCSFTCDAASVPPCGMLRFFVLSPGSAAGLKTESCATGGSSRRRANPPNPLSTAPVPAHRRHESSTKATRQAS
jgi:hypothetical protein